jgi:putative chitinase
MPDPAQDVLGAASLPVSQAGHAVPGAGVLTALGWADAGDWSAALVPACARHDITTPQRLVAFLANVGHETGGGRRLVESLNYDAPRLRALFSLARADAAAPFARTADKPADQRALANALYGGDWGRRNLGNTLPDDGWRFRGRGLIQLTGRANYERFARTLGVPLDDAMLARLETKAGAAESAAHFWAVAGCNALADARDIAAVRKRVNGGTIGLDDVQARYRMALGVLAG